MNANIAALLYLASGVLFVLSLRGLSSPETSRAGANNGIIGMAIAIVTTLWMLWDGSGGLDGVTLAIIDMAPVIAAVNAVKVLHHSTIHVSARRGPNRSPSHPPGILNSV